MTIDVAGNMGQAKSDKAFKTISEVASILDVPQHVLRFWETKFTQIKPMKRAGGRRYYRPEDVAILKAVHQMLHAEGYTIRGLQKLMRVKGVKAVIALSRGAFFDDAAGGGCLAADAGESGALTAGSGLSKENRLHLQEICDELRLIRTALAAYQG